MAKLESTIEDEACQRILLELGIFSVRLAKTSETGNVDRIFILPGGRTIWAEFKRPGEKPRKKQEVIHDRLNYFGHCMVVFDDANAAFEEVKRTYHATTPRCSPYRKVACKCDTTCGDDGHG